MRKAATIIPIVIIGILLLILFNLFRPSQDSLPVATVRYSDFIHNVNDGKLRSVTT